MTDTLSMIGRIGNTLHHSVRLLIALAIMSTTVGFTEDDPTIEYRPQFHFSPHEHWMNDPNGLVFKDGVYHAYFQHYPKDIVWGPMHWGHAISTDLLHWQEMPIALEPDELGMIFSGSVVIDEHNTSQLGTTTHPPWIALFTHHDELAKQSGNDRFERQSLAFSFDKGTSWHKYTHNPVVQNPGLIDFRDPKVFWYQPSHQWIMLVATTDRVLFFSSPNLLQWTPTGEFGQHVGAHDSVWECPDLVEFKEHGPSKWVLIVSVIKGAPNGGAGTQYFVGHFDGTRFQTQQTDIRWVDYGPDNYAGVTFSHIANRKLFMGWMNNWDYATSVPTSPWRGEFTLPRELHLKREGNTDRLTQLPAPELHQHFASMPSAMLQWQDATLDISPLWTKAHGTLKMQLQLIPLDTFQLEFSNQNGETLKIGFDATLNQYWIDRRYASQLHFNQAFLTRAIAPRLTTKSNGSVILYFDRSSVELFADDGLTAMTAQVFPTHPYTQAVLHKSNGQSKLDVLITPWVN